MLLLTASATLAALAEPGQGPAGPAGLAHGNGLLWGAPPWHGRPFQLGPLHEGPLLQGPIHEGPLLQGPIQRGTLQQGLLQPGPLQQLPLQQESLRAALQESFEPSHRCLLILILDQDPPLAAVLAALQDTVPLSVALHRTDNTRWAQGGLREGSGSGGVGAILYL